MHCMRVLQHLLSDIVFPHIYVYRINSLPRPHAQSPSSNRSSSSSSSLLRDCAVVAALSLHGAFEGAAVGLEDSAAGVWTTMAGEGGFGGNLGRNGMATDKKSDIPNYFSRPTVGLPGATRRPRRIRNSGGREFSRSPLPSPTNPPNRYRDAPPQKKDKRLSSSRCLFHSWHAGEEEAALLTRLFF